VIAGCVRFADTSLIVSRNRAEDEQFARNDRANAAIGKTRLGRPALESDSDDSFLLEEAFEIGHRFAAIVPPCGGLVRRYEILTSICALRVENALRAAFAALVVGGRIVMDATDASV